jgi:hypothetical protein
VDLTTLPLWFSVFALGCSLAAAVLTYMGRPNALRRDVMLLADDVAAFEREASRAASERVEFLKAVESVHETVRDDLERAEKKRARASASLSKAQRMTGQGDAPDYSDPTYLRQIARERGLL